MGELIRNTVTQQAYIVGIDIGSTTIKTVVLNTNGEIVFRAYERHMSRVREMTAKQLRSAAELLSGKPVLVNITGSAGLGIAKASALPFVQEVYATATAVGITVADTDVVIELGGEDAKIIFFGNSLEERMNGSCAGGTGSFIDQMATLMNVTIEELDALSLKHEKIYPIASRCGVFAKSDIQPILNQGGRHEDIAASIFQAVVNQTVSGLAQGRALTGKIVFLGGPLTYLKGLRKRFVETLKLDSEHAVFPENADCFAAIGAALTAMRESDGTTLTYEQLIDRLEKTVDSVATTDVLPPLFASEDDYKEFLTRHELPSEDVKNPDEYKGDAILGIDAGSTTTKLVLITPSGGILYSHYTQNKGQPIEIVKKQLSEIYQRFGNRIIIRHSAVCGYGEDLIRNAFGVDMGIVETIAHLRSARHYDANVDFIIDIGGQDVKCFKIHHGIVDSIMLNEACSSGCGSFIETFANALGYKISDFAQLGLFACAPVNLGSRCTVFMNSSVKQAQKEGSPVDAISAGLSVSIVKNALYKVIRAATADDLGQHIIVQGGTFLNDAVLRAFEREIGTAVIRPPIAGLMGAYGAALLAADTKAAESTLMAHDQLAAFTHTSKPTTCNGCTNHCSLTVNIFNGDQKFISGNRCSKPLGVEKSTAPNLMRYKYEKLRSLNGKGNHSGWRGKVGIPFGLNMYENLPFWFAFFTNLDYEVVLSLESSRQIYIKGQQTIPSDTVCYPAKLLHGHVEQLLDMEVDFIFYPCMPYNFDEGISDNHYNCPVVAYYPELLAVNMPRLKAAKYLYPYFNLENRKGFIKRAVDYFGEHLHVTASNVKNAAKAAYQAYTAYRNDIIVKGEEYIALARDSGMRIIVTAGRPYHIDPEINHGIDELMTSYGLAIITEDALSAMLAHEPRRVLNQWTYQARMYNAARYIVTQPDMQMVQLVSFGCGTDAITTDELRSILEDGGKLYTQLKIDDITGLGAVRIRIRSLIAACESRAGREAAWQS